MNFFAQTIGIQQTKYTCCSLAADNGTHLCPCTARHQASFRKVFPEGLNIFKGNSLHLNRQACCHCKLTIAEFLRRLRDAAALSSRNLPIPRDNTSGKIICSFIMQKT